MTAAEDFLDREASSWAALEAAVARVPEGRRERSGVVEGWTVKDIVWHCAHWSRFAAEHLMEEGDGPYTDPFAGHPDEYWDGVNDEVAKASSTMTWDDVWAGAREARATLRAAVGRPGLPPEPLAFAADESWIHYDEHAGHVRAFAAGHDRIDAGGASHAGEAAESG